MIENHEGYPGTPPPGTEAEVVVERFADRMGRVAQGDGLPRIAGQIFGLLVVQGEALDAAELARRLRASRGSISTNTRLLEGLGLVERTGRPGARRDLFRIADQPYARLLLGHAERLRRAAAAVREAERDLPPSWTGARARLAELRGFYEAAIRSTERLVGTLSE